VDFKYLIPPRVHVLHGYSPPISVFELEAHLHRPLDEGKLIWT
jgi:hypothetical protein